MTNSAPKVIAANWKMNGELDTVAQLLPAFEAEAAKAQTSGTQVVVCPPAPLIPAALNASTAVAVGGQDCHAQQSGAHTGDLSAKLLAQLGCRYVIVGHSERRADHGEDDAQVAAKALAAQNAGLIPIICVGESDAVRNRGEHLGFVADSLVASTQGLDGKRLVIAYEPIWAIGTGNTATPEMIGEMHSHLRHVLVQRFGEETGRAITIQYGGSVKASNAAEILSTPNVDGALVGGASLKADEFTAIIAASADA